jgi:hypothetical protein
MRVGHDLGDRRHRHDDLAAGFLDSVEIGLRVVDLDIDDDPVGTVGLPDAAAYRVLATGFDNRIGRIAGKGLELPAERLGVEVGARLSFGR